MIKNKHNLDEVDKLINARGLSVEDVVNKLRELQIQISGRNLRKIRSDFSKSKQARQLTTYYRWIGRGILTKHKFTNANIVDAVDTINDKLYSNGQ